MSQKLPMPFVELTDVDIAFGGIPNMAEAIAACPEEFRYSSNPYDKVMQDLFAHQAGWRSMTPQQIADFRAAADPERYSDEKWRYVQAWLGSFEPSHHDKSAVVAWCLSQMMKEVPASWRK